MIDTANGEFGVITEQDIEAVNKTIEKYNKNMDKVFFDVIREMIDEVKEHKDIFDDRIIFDENELNIVGRYNIQWSFLIDEINFSRYKRAYAPNKKIGYVSADEEEIDELFRRDTFISTFEITNGKPEDREATHFKSVKEFTDKLKENEKQSLKGIPKLLEYLRAIILKSHIKEKQ